IRIFSAKWVLNRAQVETDTSFDLRRCPAWIVVSSSLAPMGYRRLANSTQFDLMPLTAVRFLTSDKENRDPERPSGSIHPHDYLMVCEFHIHRAGYRITFP